MRVITGSARGRRLETMPGEDVTRPTSESVKEALFSMIQFEIEGKRVLDLFAGSGQLGIEALSRGATSCVFVENNKSARDVVERNILHCGLQDRASIYLSDAASYAARNATYDIAFLDPPYHKNMIDKVLPLVAAKMSSNGIIACETAKDEELPRSCCGFEVVKEKKYGKIKLTLYRKEAEE